MGQMGHEVDSERSRSREFTAHSPLFPQSPSLNHLYTNTLLYQASHSVSHPSSAFQKRDHGPDTPPIAIQTVLGHSGGIQRAIDGAARGINGKQVRVQGKIGFTG